MNNFWVRESEFKSINNIDKSRLLTRNEVAELVGKIEGSHLITLAERIGLDIVLGTQDAKTASIVDKQARQEERKKIVDWLLTQGAVWVDKNYSIIEAIRKGQELKRGVE